MSATVLTVLGVALAAAALAWVLRTFSSRSDETVRMPAEPDAPPAALEEPEDEAFTPRAGETIALSSDGLAFMPAARSVHLIVSGGARESIVAGDLVGARVTRGAPDHDPWRLEAIGRDGDYRAWRFETEDAARAALEMVQRVVRPGRDEEGEPRPPSDADYADALRREETIMAELALSSEPLGDEDDSRNRFEPGA
jgi:hypothetical protein